MPEKKTLARAKRDKAQGKSPSTQAGEFVREEIHHVREGKHGARSPKQAIAIGLAKARRAGVELPPPEPGTTSEETRRSAERPRESRGTGSRRSPRAIERGQGRAARRAPSKKRSSATRRALKREGHAAASRKALGKQARAAAKKRGPAKRSAAAKKAVRTRRSARAKRSTSSSRGA